MGWNVLKVVWGRQWDELLAAPGCLVNRMNSTVDGEFQKYAVESGRVHPRALLRRDPRLRQDGGARSGLTTSCRTPRAVTTTAKIFAAYKTAVEHEELPP